TRPGSYWPTFVGSCPSQVPRSRRSFRRHTKVGTPSSAARSSPAHPGRSAPPATICPPQPGSRAAFSSAARLEPPPEINTTIRLAVTALQRSGAAPFWDNGTTRRLEESSAQPLRPTRPLGATTTAAPARGLPTPGPGTPPGAGPAAGSGRRPARGWVRAAGSAPGAPHAQSRGGTGRRPQRAEVRGRVAGGAAGDAVAGALAGGRTGGRGRGGVLGYPCLDDLPAVRGLHVHLGVPGDRRGDERAAHVRLTV